MVSVPATGSARPGFESRPGASPQSGLRGGRSLCEYCTNKLKQLGWLQVEKKYFLFYFQNPSLYIKEQSPKIKFEIKVCLVFFLIFL